MNVLPSLKKEALGAWSAFKKDAIAITAGLGVVGGVFGMVTSENGSLQQKGFALTTLTSIVALRGSAKSSGHSTDEEFDDIDRAENLEIVHSYMTGDKKVSKRVDNGVKRRDLNVFQKAQITSGEVTDKMYPLLNRRRHSADYKHS